MTGPYQLHWIHLSPGQGQIDSNNFYPLSSVDVAGADYSFPIGLFPDGKIVFQFAKS